VPSTYFAVFTTLGLTRLAEAQASGVPLVFTHVAVGDGNGSPITPNSSMTALVHEVARVTVNDVQVVDDEPTTVRVEGLLPAATGGFTVHEAGLFNGAGEMIAVASYPPMYKPVPSDGASVDEYIRILLVYEAVESIALTVDPAVIVATRQYVDAIETQLDSRITYLENVALGFELGDGSDGSADLDGTNTYPWASKVGSVYTLIRPPHLVNLRGRNGVTLKRANIPLRGTGTYTLDAGYEDECNGEDGTDGDSGAPTTTPGGAGVPFGVFLGSGDGGDGHSNGAAGDAGTSVSDSVGGNGGRGGDLLGVNTGGAAGVATPPDMQNGDSKSFRALIEGYLLGNSAGTAALTGLRGGAGGGGGVGANGSLLFAGSGAGGGGISATAFRAIVNNGAIRANGGKGGDGTSFGGIRAGSGGGGAGGRVGIGCGAYSGTGIVEAKGGSRGAIDLASGTTATNATDGEVVIIIATAPPTGPHVEEGKAIFSNADTVVVTFPDTWTYANASGINGYKLKVFAPYLTDDVYDGVDVWITDKTLTGFTIRTNAPITGEIDWRTEGY